MMTTIKRFLIGAICLLPTLASRQEPYVPFSLTQLMAAYRHPELKDMIVNHVSATETGVGYANSAIRKRKQEPPYCPPDRMVLTGEQVIDIMERWARNKDAMFAKDFPWELVMINALQDAFPCR
jgi:hypothetical protein